MKPHPDFVRNKFTPLREKTIKNALAYRLRQDFPRLGGDRILNLCAEMILEVIEQHLRPLEQVSHGQAVWMAVSIDDPPTQGKRMTHTKLIPTVLDLSTGEDIEAIINRKSISERVLHKALRLCQQAHAQGALLSNCDLAELLNRSESQIATLLAGHEHKQQQVVPRRATLHDLGTSLTHKRIICWKRYAEGKSQDQIARETHHSLEAVDRYLGTFDRVRHCIQQGMTPTEIAFTLNCSLSLVTQYIAINDELKTDKQSRIVKDQQQKED